MLPLAPGHSNGTSRSALGSSYPQPRSHRSALRAGPLALARPLLLAYAFSDARSALLAGAGGVAAVERVARSETVIADRRSRTDARSTRSRLLRRVGDFFTRQWIIRPQQFVFLAGDAAPCARRPGAPRAQPPYALAAALAWGARALLLASYAHAALRGVVHALRRSVPRVRNGCSRSPASVWLRSSLRRRAQPAAGAALRSHCSLFDLHARVYASRLRGPQAQRRCFGPRAGAARVRPGVHYAASTSVRHACRVSSRWYSTTAPRRRRRPPIGCTAELRRLEQRRCRRALAPRRADVAFHAACTCTTPPSRCGVVRASRLSTTRTCSGHRRGVAVRAPQWRLNRPAGTVARAASSVRLVRASGGGRT